MTEYKAIDYIKEFLNTSKNMDKFEKHAFARATSDQSRIEQALDNSSWRVFKFKTKLKLIGIKANLRYKYTTTKYSLKYSLVGLLLSNIKDSFTIDKFLKSGLLISASIILNLLFLDMLLHIFY